MLDVSEGVGSGGALASISLVDGLRTREEVRRDMICGWEVFFVVL